MIWIWLATRHSHKWATGTLDRYFAFICAHCGVSTAAMVRTFGFGSGSSQWAAERSAHAAADLFAFRAVSASACPHCNQLQPTVMQGFAAAAKRAARAQTLRIPLALAAAVLTAIILAIPAIGDIRHSMTLSVVAVSTAGAVGSLFFAFLSGAVVTPSTNPSGLWFSRDPSQGVASWFPAQPGQAPIIAQPPSFFRVLSLVALGVTGVTAIVALILYGETFRKVYVVSGEGPGSLAIRVDDAEPAQVWQNTSDDAPTAIFEVRTDAKHRIVATTADGRASTFELDPDLASHGWVLAPHARERGLCLTKITMYYGTTPKDGDDGILSTKSSDLVVLPHSFDHMFTPTPATVQTKNGASATRTSLRALDCTSLAEEKIVAFKDAPRLRK